VRWKHRAIQFGLQDYEQLAAKAGS
jgi:hypothetical protein